MAVLVMIGALILCFSGVQLGEYAQKGQDLAKEKITQAVRLTLEEAAEGAGVTASSDASPPVPEGGERSAQGRPPSAGSGPELVEGGRVEPVAEEEVSRKRNHWVRRGETLFSIAVRHYNDGRRWKEIARANRLGDPRKLKAGTRLEIP